MNTVTVMLMLRTHLDFIFLLFPDTTNHHTACLVKIFRQNMMGKIFLVFVSNDWL